LKGSHLVISMMLASSVLGLHAFSQAQTSQGTSQDTQGNRKGAFSDQTPQPKQNAQESSKAQLHELNARADQQQTEQDRLLKKQDSITKGGSPGTSDAQGRSSVEWPVEARLVQVPRERLEVLLEV